MVIQVLTYDTFLMAPSVVEKYKRPQNRLPSSVVTAVGIRAGPCGRTAPSNPQQVSDRQLGRYQRVIYRQNAFQYVVAVFTANLSTDIANPQSDIASEHPIAILRRPDQVITVIKNAVLALGNIACSYPPENESFDRARVHFLEDTSIRRFFALKRSEPVALLCSREEISQGIYYKWSKDFMEAGKKRLAGDTARAANTDEVKELRREAKDLKEVVAEQTRELRILKKSMTDPSRQIAVQSPAEKWMGTTTNEISVTRQSLLAAMRGGI